MKSILSILLVFSATQAFAGYDCKSADGKTTLVIGGTWFSGSTAELRSAEVEKYYSQQHGISVGALKTIIDPETRKAISEVQTTDQNEVVYSFMQKSSKNTTGSTWNLAFKPATNKAVLIDQEGKQFNFKLNCETTPDLE